MTVFLQACMLGSSAAGCFYSPASLAAMCAAYLALMGLSAALAIPGGLFMPSMMVGGSFGALAGFALRAALRGLVEVPRVDVRTTDGYQRASAEPRMLEQTRA